jgi:hypothetical protein
MTLLQAGHQPRLAAGRVGGIHVRPRGAGGGGEEDRRGVPDG